MVIPWPEHVEPNLKTISRLRNKANTPLMSSDPTLNYYRLVGAIIKTLGSPNFENLCNLKIFKLVFILQSFPRKKKTYAEMSDMYFSVRMKLYWNFTRSSCLWSPWNSNNPNNPVLDQIGIKISWWPEEIARFRMIHRMYFSLSYAKSYS